MNPIAMLGYGRRDIDALIDRMRPDDWAAIALGTWTSKDLAGHLGAFEVRFADILAVFLGDSPDTDLMQTDPATFNDDQAAVRRDWTVEAVVAELRDASRRVAERAGRIPTERWTEVGTIPWYGPEYALDDLVVYSMYGHKREHAPQFEAVLDRPGRA
jgi:Mycothiol maleylpyruvate isomerase N-terminal domain